VSHSLSKLLILYAQQFEDQQAPQNMTIALREAADTITRFTAEVERLRAALCVCELELNAYYRMQYPGDHPYSQKELAQAMASNPATVALKEKP
jgi:hypothetical protein